MDLHELLRPPIDLRALESYLDGLDPGAREDAALSITSRQQADLFEAARGHRAITVGDFVPPGCEPLARVDHVGRNTLAPGFRRFEKRFCRPDDPEARSKGELWGYNHQFFAGATGPGYFVAYDLPGGEVLIDYTRVPPHAPPGWPKVLPNSARLSRFVYFNTQDTMRGVSRHVTIGRAARAGTWMDNWFVLCRRDPQPAPARP